MVAERSVLSVWCSVTPRITTVMRAHVTKHFCGTYEGPLLSSRPSQELRNVLSHPAYSVGKERTTERPQADSYPWLVLIEAWRGMCNCVCPALPQGRWRTCWRRPRRPSWSGGRSCTSCCRLLPPMISCCYRGTAGSSRFGVPQKNVLAF